MPENASQEDANQWARPGFRLRVAASMLIGLGWFVFAIVWLFFYASGFTILQNVVLIFASIVVAFVLNGIVWMGVSRPIAGTTSAEQGPPPGWRLPVTIASGLLWLAFLGIWLLFFASNYTIYQNFGVFLVSLAVIGAIMALVWVPFGMRAEREKREREAAKA